MSTPLQDDDGRSGAYDLTALGWLLFEQLTAGWLERAVGLDPAWWTGSADRQRYALLEQGLPEALSTTPLPGPTLVATAWVPPGDRSPGAVLIPIGKAWAAASQARADDPPRSLLVLTNVRAETVREGLGSVHASPSDWDESLPLHVLGVAALGAAIDADADLRLGHPYVMGVRDGGPKLPPGARDASTLDLDAARELARVYVPSGPYRRALGCLRQHSFCVLTGPPEMGKTAAARMLGLALLTAGWEVHECNSPDQLTRALDPARRQLFVADDAFGSTEYRPDAAERWARALPEILRATDERHWLVWTSRPTPLKAGLRAIHRERGGERFPAPAEVHVDAADLDTVEKTLILFRHANDAGLHPSALRVVRDQGAEIVDHRHFTPERIRRFVTTELTELTRGGTGRGAVARAVARQIERPTEAMATSYLALTECQRAVLVAMLDCPAGAVSERDLAAAARRHAPAGLDRAPFDLVDRLADHFLRMTSTTGVAWVHPSWRDLVIAQLAGDRAARGRFLTSCGLHGALLALSVAGGEEGARRLPLLARDADWDALGDRLPELVRTVDERSLGELLTTLAVALEESAAEPREHAELASLASLASLALTLAGRTRPAHQPVGVGLVEAWLRLAALLPGGAPPPWLTATWIDLLPAAAPDPDSPVELGRYEDWLVLARALKRLAADHLPRLGFPGDQAQIARALAAAARPRVAAAPDSPRAARVSRLVLQAASLLGERRDPAFDVARRADEESRSADVVESGRIRGRHLSAAATDSVLIDRVLHDLTARVPDQA